jgi:hypothetical protein
MQNLVEKCDGKKHIGRPGHRWKSIKHFEERNVFKTETFELIFQKNTFLFFGLRE